MRTKERSWVETDRQAVLQDLARLGLNEAVCYQLDLMQTSDDPDWRAAGAAATVERMREAILEALADDIRERPGQWASLLSE